MILYAVFGVILIAASGVVLWPARKHKRFFLIAAATFFIGASGLYYMLGAPEIIPLLQQRDVKIAALKDTIIKYSAEVKAEPKNTMAWAELGRSFMETGQYKAAANAFLQSVVLSHGDPPLLLAYAAALIADADGQVSDDAKKALEVVLMQQADNPEARYFLAIRAMQDGRSAEAMKTMKTLYHSLPADSPLKAMIDRQIGRE